MIEPVVIKTPGEGAHAESSPQVAEVWAGLRSSRSDPFDAAVLAAVGLGEEGDALLAGLEGVRGWRAVYVTAALGDVVGPHGGAVLRERIAAQGRGTSDLRCAALLALAKREGVAASDVLAEAVADADAGVREYAVMGLAAVGDGRAWDAVLSRLTAMLARQRAREGEPSAAVLAVVYLLRHAGEDGTRAAQIVSLLRRRWRFLFDRERRWFEDHWPALQPGPEAASEPPLPHATAVQRWLLDHPLFAKPAIS